MGLRLRSSRWRDFSQRRREIAGTLVHSEGAKDQRRYSVYMTSKPDLTARDLAWFVARLNVLTSTRDWLDITMRVGDSVEQASDAARWIVTGADRSLSSSARRERVAALHDAHDRVAAALDHLPKRVVYNGDDVPLRLAATTAATHVANGLLAGADLPPPQFAAVTLPFLGYVDFEKRPSRAG